jgi:hypothetical protein
MTGTRIAAQSSLAALPITLWGRAVHTRGLNRTALVGQASDGYLS